MSYPTEDMVWKHSKASGSALTVLLALARHANNKTHIAWPSIDTLASLSRIDRRNVIRHLQALVKMGEIEVAEDRKGKTTKYRITCGNTITCDEITTGDVDGERGDETVTTGGDASATRTVTVELLEEPLPPISPPTDAFETFWSISPKRTGGNPKAPALKSFTKAIKRGVDPNVILDGARKWRAQCEGEGILGTKFVPQAVTWLNQERWNDEYTDPGNSRTEERRRAILDIVGLESGSADPAQGADNAASQGGPQSVSGRTETDISAGYGGCSGDHRGVVGSVLRSTTEPPTGDSEGVRTGAVLYAIGSRHDGG
jgi:hypothetical protein